VPPDTLVRAPTLRDVAAIADALAAHDRAALGPGAASEEEIRSWFSLPGLDPANDMRVAVAADGVVLAYADIAGGNGPEAPLSLDLRARPGATDAAAGVLRAMEKRAASRGAPPRPLRAWVPGNDTEGQALMAAAGYEPVRRAYRMAIELDREPDEADWPAGLSPTTFSPGADDEAVYEAQMDAFADHWGFQRLPYDQWRHLSFSVGFDPGLWFLVRDGGEVAALCLCREQASDEPEAGWVATLGVRRPWRRRGLGTALLLHAFHELRARGCPRAALGVDAENTTGAVGLYERAGMRPVRWSDTYQRVW
jgi:mycothiol synthase